MSMKFFPHGGGNYSVHKDGHKVGEIRFQGPKKYSLNLKAHEPLMCKSIRQAKYKAMWTYNDWTVKNYLYH